MDNFCWPDQSISKALMEQSVKGIHRAFNIFQVYQYFLLKFEKIS
jgi:hypothetical protein